MTNVDRTGRPSAQIVAVEQQSTRTCTGQANAGTETTMKFKAVTSAPGRECGGDGCADCPSCSAIESLEITGLSLFLTEDLLSDPEARYLGVRIRELALLPGHNALQRVSEEWQAGLPAPCQR